MQNLLRQIQRHWLGYGVISLACCIQVYLVIQPLSFLISNILPDDAFYYFEIARNVAQGLGSTFDGINGTNGYHPLWLLILIGIYVPAEAFTWGALFPFQLALFVSVGLNVFTSIMLYNILGRYTTSLLLQAIVLAIWALNPFVLYETINGLETSLGLFFLLLFMTLAFRFEHAFSSRRLVILGLVAGCMILARVDLVFYFIAFLIWFFITQQFWASWKKILIIGLTASAIVVPWLLWNILGYGMLLTSASEGNSFVNKALTHQSGIGPLFEVKHILYHLYNYGKIVLQITGMQTIFLVLLGFFACIKLNSGAGVFKVQWKHIPIEAAFVFGFLLLFFADAGIRFTGRSWYFISISIFVAMLCAVVLPHIISKVGKYKNILVGGFIFCVIGSFAISWREHLQDQMPNQRVMYEATIWGNSNLQEGAVIGAFNAGILGYFSTHTVINLDGLVNNSALEALKEGTVWDYLGENAIAYISDGEYYFTHRYSAFLGIDNPLEKMIPLKVFSIQGGTKSVTSGVYEVLE